MKNSCCHLKIKVFLKYFLAIFAFGLGGCSGVEFGDCTPLSVSSLGNQIHVETTEGKIFGRNVGLVIPYYDASLDDVRDYWNLGNRIWPKDLSLYYEAKDKSGGVVEKIQLTQDSFSYFRLNSDGELVRVPGVLSIIFKTKDFSRFGDFSKWEKSCVSGRIPCGFFNVHISQSVYFIKGEKYQITLRVESPTNEIDCVYFVSSEQK